LGRDENAKEYLRASNELSAEIKAVRGGSQRRISHWFRSMVEESGSDDGDT
jgi:hypothetical protein